MCLPTAAAARPPPAGVKEPQSAALAGEQARAAIHHAAEGAPGRVLVARLLVLYDSLLGCAAGAGQPGCKALAGLRSLVERTQVAKNDAPGTAPLAGGGAQAAAEGTTSEPAAASEAPTGRLERAAEAAGELAASAAGRVKHVAAMATGVSKVGRAGSEAERCTMGAHLP